jgi:hypothetical protein
MFFSVMLTAYFLVTAVKTLLFSDSAQLKTNSGANENFSIDQSGTGVIFV